MDTRSLTDDPPGTPEWSEITRLADRRAEFAGRVDGLDREQRAATEARDAASAAVVDVERRRLNGEDVTTAEQKRVEAALEKARSEVAAPWSERQLAVRRAIGDLDREVQAYVTANFDALVEGLTAKGREAAEAIDRAAADLISAVAVRESVASRMAALASTVRPIRPGDITRSQAERVANEAGRMLDNGGEVAPTLTHDPRSPRYAEPEPGAEAVIA